MNGVRGRDRRKERPARRLLLSHYKHGSTRRMLKSWLVMQSSKYVNHCLNTCFLIWLVEINIMLLSNLIYLSVIILKYEGWWDFCMEFIVRMRKWKASISAWKLRRLEESSWNIICRKRPVMQLVKFYWLVLYWEVSSPNRLLVLLTRRRKGKIMLPGLCVCYIYCLSTLITCHTG